MEESKSCVRVFKCVCVSVCCFYFPSFLECKGAFLGRQGSGKTPLEDQRDSRQHPEGNVIQRSSRRKARMQQKKKKKGQKKLLENKPSLHSRLSPNDEIRPTDLSEMRCLRQTLRILHFVWETSNRSGPRENNGGRGHRNSSVTTNNSHGGKNQKKKNLLRGLLQKESSRNNTPPARGEEEKKKEMKKVRFPPPLLFFFFLPDH